MSRSQSETCGRKSGNSRIPVSASNATAVLQPQVLKQETRAGRRIDVVVDDENTRIAGLTEITEEVRHGSGVLARNSLGAGKARTREHLTWDPAAFRLPVTLRGPVPAPAALAGLYSPGKHARRDIGSWVS